MSTIAVNDATRRANSAHDRPGTARARRHGGTIAVAVALVAGCLAVAPAHDASHHGAAAVSPPGSAATPNGEAAYLAENDTAMSKMMDDMTVRPSGDVDRDFVAMMVPHHQGAVDMAVAVLRYGHNERIRRLAQEIIVTQQEEIAAMRLALGESLPPSVSAPTQVAPVDATVPHAGSEHSTNMHQEH